VAPWWPSLDKRRLPCGGRIGCDGPSPFLLLRFLILILILIRQVQGCTAQMLHQQVTSAATLQTLPPPPSADIQTGS
jgi:hypothetical protein